MMFDWFAKPTVTLTGGAVVLGTLSFISRLFGLWRDRTLAGTFGAGDTLDVYYAAFRIPDFVFALLVTGALSASFIPLFVRHLHASGEVENEGWNFTSRMLIGLGVLFGVGAVVGMIFASPLAQLIAPGFVGAKHDTVAAFMRILFLAQGLLAISSVFSSVLQATRRFLLFALSPVLYNVGIIFGVYTLVPIMGASGLAWGVVLGAALHALLPAVGVYRMGYRLPFPRPWLNDDVRSALLLFGPRVLGIAMAQFQFVLLGILASTLASGSVAVFQFAYNLVSLPIGILAVSYALAAFPALSTAAKERDTPAFSNTMSQTVRQLLFFMIPATLVLLLLRAQAVRLVFGAGTFGWEETLLVADTLAFLALSLFAQALNLLFIRAFFAYRDSVTPLVAGGIGTLVLFLVARAFAGSYGIGGLAIAFSLAQIVELTLLWAMLRVKIGSLDETRLLSHLLKMTAAGLVAGLLMQAAKPITVYFVALDTFHGVFVQTVFVGAAGVFVYLGICYMLHLEELRSLIHAFDRRILRRFRPEEGGPVGNDGQVL